MNRKNLFICETPFQVLAAILHMFDSLMTDKNDFILTDNMVVYKELAEGLKKCPGIKNSFYAETEINNGKKDNIGKIKDMIIPFGNRWDFAKDCNYDYIYCRNYTSIITESAFRYYKKKNQALEIIVFDEGYSTYSSEFWMSHKHISIFHKALQWVYSGHMDYLYQNISKLLLFDKDLFHVDTPFPVEKMLGDSFHLTEIQVEIINNVFGYEKNENWELDGKVIFFEECFSFDNGNNSDLEIVKKISNVVGKENIIIKLHPRSKKDRFTPLNYKVIENMKYIWEIFVLNNSSCNITLISFSSGALLNYLFFSSGKIKSILLYKLFPDKYSHMKDAHTRRWFNEFVNKHSEAIKVPESLEDLNKLL